MPKQVLSAAVDAAATEAEWDALLQATEREPAITAEWSRIWEWRDARDGIAIAGSDSFCAGVMASIAQEKPLPSNVVALPAKTKPAVARAAPGWRTLVPLSAAAGVVAAVVMVGVLRDPITTAGSTVASGQSAVVTTPVSLAAAEANPPPADAAQAAILNAYLMEHSNSLAERSMGGTLANARFAARTADYRPDAP